jgi:hypothetical protein
MKRKKSGVREALDAEVYRSVRVVRVKQKNLQEKIDEPLPPVSSQPNSKAISSLHRSEDQIKIKSSNSMNVYA